MKKFIKAVVVLAICTLAVTGIQAQKFGYINSAAILAELPDVKAAEANLEALQTQLQKKGQEMVQDLQADYAAVQDKVAKGEMSPKQQETEAARLEQKQSALQTFEQEMMQQIQTKRNELLEPIYEKINKAIEEVAKENGYQYIFDQGVLLYSNPEGDVSELVKAKLNM